MTPTGGAVSLLKLLLEYHIPGCGCGMWEDSMKKGAKDSNRQCLVSRSIGCRSARVLAS